METFIKTYFSRLADVLSALDTTTVARIIQVFEQAHTKQATIYFAGNGGSASTASHFANDLGVGLKLRSIRSFHVQSLADNPAVTTSIANDVGYDNIFYVQLLDILRPDDVLVAISASGNSPNIIKAAEYTKNIGATLIGCTGFDGGKLKDLADISFHIQSEKGEYGLVEDVHMILDHAIYSYYLSLKEGSSTRYTVR
ncbi:D-sedoheptulose-7-phosphate isomerase [Chrysiogenes arsenatis]|uniref:D-sedoheptulose-7-phosphate isomerase n=1 Tax=Chrysiogenes arsenatis TaxID=309797 RepID=UPI0004113004|nr:SIS domain-containing protein [Chrysiogenes arsenatis]